MAIKFILSLILFLGVVLPVYCGIEPFPSGFSMGNLGTIIWEDGISGRQPWIPSAYLRDSLKFGLSFSGISYYDDMDNMKNARIYKALGGARCALEHITLKASFSYLDGFGVYFEETGFISVGTNLIPFCRLSIEAGGTRSGVKTSFDEENRVMGEMGSSIWIPFRFACLAVSVNHIVLKKSGYTGFDPQISIRTSVHTVRNRFGAQGVLLEFTPSDTKPVNLAIGEEYRICKWIGIQFSVAGNPVLIGTAIAVELSSTGFDIAFVNHPILGWSKGFAVDFSGRRSGS